MKKYTTEFPGRLMHSFSLPVLIASLFLLFSCAKDEAEPENDFPEIKKGEGVFIVNEGNFQWGNSSLSFYHRESNTMYNGLFKKANGEDLGDIFQSMHIHQDHAYLVLNNSGKIEVIDPESCLRTGTISGLVSPRYFLPVNDQEAYVSDLYGNHLAIVDLEKQEVSGEIPINGWSEALLLAGNKVLATGMESGYVYVIDPANHSLTDSIHAGPGPSAMVKDKNGHVWVLCGGMYDVEEEPLLLQLDVESLEVLQNIALPGDQTLYSRLSVSPDGKTLYFSGQGIYAFSINGSSPEPEILISPEGQVFYGLKADPHTGEIFVSDAVDFVQKGKVMRYTPEGSLIDHMEAMIIPGDFIFY